MVRGKGLGKKEDGRSNIKQHGHTRGVGQEVNLTGAAGWDAQSWVQQPAEPAQQVGG